MNKTIDWRLLKKLYAIHSPSGKEDKMHLTFEKGPG